MRKDGARYLVGTPKVMLKKFEQQLLEHDWEEVQPGVNVKIRRSPEGTDETFVLCRPEGRKEKENAILGRFVTRLENKLSNLARRAEAGKVRDKQKVERRIRRLLEQNNHAASLFNITVTDTGTEKDSRLSIRIKKHEGQWQLHPAHQLV